MEAYKFVNADKYDHLTDEEIVNRVIDGEKSLFEVIMRRYNQRLYRIQKGYISDEEDVKDTLQTTYIKAYKELYTFRGEAAFSTWLTRIAINEALLFIKKQKSHSNLHLYGSDDDKPEATSTFNSPDQQSIDQETREVLEKAINKLPSKYRSVYIMREVEEMSTKDTALALDISESNVKVRLMRAKEKLRDILENEVKDTEAFVFLGHQCDEIVENVMREI